MCQLLNPYTCFTENTVPLDSSAIATDANKNTGERKNSPSAERTFDSELYATRKMHFKRVHFNMRIEDTLIIRI
jgi:hypothetical protein